jgi:hypothetical protein
MAIDYPFYEISAGKRAGVHQFLFVTEAEFRQLGESRSKIIEYDRIRSRRISANPELRAKWSARRAYRRNHEPGLREREVELQRNRRKRKNFLPG